MRKDKIEKIRDLVESRNEEECMSEHEWVEHYDKVFEKIEEILRS